MENGELPLVYGYLTKEDPLGGGSSDMSHLFCCHAVSLSEFTEHFPDVGRFVALSTMGNGCHIRGIGLKDDPVERYHCGQHLRQMALLERQHTTDAKYEVVELQEFARLNLVAGETVEHTAREISLIPL